MPWILPPVQLPKSQAGRLIDLTAKRPVSDIARAHEPVVDVAPSAAVPTAVAPTRDCIFRVDIAIVLAHDFPREWRADPRE